MPSAKTAKSKADLAASVKATRAENRRKVGLGKLLRGAHIAFSGILRAHLAAHKITFSQFQHLQNLWKADGINQAELSLRIGITNASSTAVLDSLEQRGFIHRVRNREDRRKISVYLTKAGAALEDELGGYAADVNIRATRGLSEAQVREMYSSLEKVIQNLRSASPKADDGDAEH